MKQCRFCEKPVPSDHLNRFMTGPCTVDYVCDKHLYIVPKSKRIREQQPKPTTQANQTALW